METRPSNQGNPPTIARATEGVVRPFWSVMIPTYRPGADFEQTLRSVLDQDPGPDRMQIAVVDDRSPDRGPEPLVRRLAGDRIEIHHQPTNVGLARNWNGAIERARGRWVHLLHQDDYVLPGFYDRLGRADATSAGSAFCRHRFVDGDDAAIELSRNLRDEAGLLEDWPARISQSQEIQCPSIVVRREAYEKLGGFRLDLVYALDWEMWCRLASAYDCWFEPEVLAAYRIHPGNETARLKRDDRDLRDVQRAIRIIAGYLPTPLSHNAGANLMTFFRDEAFVAMYGHLGRGDARSALRALRRARRADNSWTFRRQGWAPARWAAKILIRDLVAGRRRAAGPGPAGNP